MLKAMLIDHEGDLLEHTSHVEGLLCGVDYRLNGVSSIGQGGPMCVSHCKGEGMLDLCQHCKGEGRTLWLNVTLGKQDCEKDLLELLLVERIRSTQCSMKMVLMDL